MKRVWVVSNPRSGRGRGLATGERVAEALQQAGYESISMRVPDALKLGDHPRPHAIIAIGGDGTVRAVVEESLKHYPHDKLPKILIVPRGTANLLALHLKLKFDWHDLPAQVIALLKNHKVLNHDVALANGRPFLLMASLGLDAKIVHLMQAGRTGPITKASYLLPAVKTLFEFEPQKMKVIVDGQVVFDRGGAMLLAGNVKEYGAGFPITPDAKPDDGLLDVCVMPIKNLRALFNTALMASVGEHVRGPGVVHSRGKRIEIECDLPVPMQIDGEASGFAPAVIQVLETRVPLIVPE